MNGDINYEEVFGVEAGANVQESADLANAENQSEGANVQESADLAGENIDSENGLADNSTAQSAEENARYAAIRRRAEAERDLAIKQARDEMNRALDETFSNSGLVNPYTNTPIRTKKEYDEYKTRYEAEYQNRIKAQSGLNDEEYQRFVDSLPEVRKAKFEAEEARKLQVQARLDNDIKAIGALDNSIKELADLSKKDYYPSLYKYVEKGFSLVEAYKLATYDSNKSNTASLAKQAAYNAVNSKQHLTTTSMRGKGASPVPNDVREMYKQFNPGATDAEIQAHYNKYINK